MELDELVRRERIRDLVARYAMAIDRRDLDTLVELFVTDVHAGRYGTGREALRQSFDESLRAIGRSFLFVGTHQIDVVDERHATGLVYTKAEIEGDGQWIHQAILYTDDYRVEDDRVLFVRRRHELFYGTEVGANPLSLPPANWPERHVGMGTVPERFDTWRRFWGTTG